MVSWDYFIGFEKKPEGLDSFLKDKGCHPIPNENDSSVKNYEYGDGLIDIFYYPKALEVEKGEEPNWSKSGYKVISDLNIVTKEGDVVDKAEKLSVEIVKKFDGILYNTSLGEFFRKDEL